MRAWIEDGEANGSQCPRVGRCREGLTLIDTKELAVLTRLADAARKDYEAAKRACGEYYPEANPDCYKAMGYRKCLACPLDWFSEIEEAVKEEKGGNSDEIR